MVQVMPWVSDGHITENTTICPQDIVCLGPYLPPKPYHAPRPPIPSPWAPLQGEVGQHVLQSHRRQCRCYLLLSTISLGLLQICVEVSRHQQLRSPGTLFERCDDTLYCQGVVGGEVTSDDVPSPLPRFQLGSENVWTKC